VTGACPGAGPDFLIKTSLFMFLSFLFSDWLVLARLDVYSSLLSFGKKRAAFEKI
jgi:hypothetical protein